MRDWSFCSYLVFMVWVIWPLRYLKLQQAAKRLLVNQDEWENSKSRHQGSNGIHRTRTKIQAGIKQSRLNVLVLDKLIEGSDLDNWQVLFWMLFPGISKPLVDISTSLAFFGHNISSIKFSCPSISAANLKSVAQIYLFESSTTGDHSRKSTSIVS